MDTSKHDRSKHTVDLLSRSHFERVENTAAENHFNCPIVQSYPEVIRNNVDAIREGAVDYRCPFLNLADEASMVKTLMGTFQDFGFLKTKLPKRCAAASRTRSVQSRYCETGRRNAANADDDQPKRDRFIWKTVSFGP